MLTVGEYGERVHGRSMFYSCSCNYSIGLKLFANKKLTTTHIHTHMEICEEKFQEERRTNHLYPNALPGKTPVFIYPSPSLL